MLTADQLTRRKQGIGASEVGAILGLSKWKTALDVYMDKLGLTDPSGDSEAAEWGHRLEEPIAKKYAAAFPGAILDTSDTVAHPDYLWALATPDRIVHADDQRWLLEIKTREAHTAGEFGEPGTDQVPYDVAVQCQWQMFVTGHSRCDVALLVNGRRFSVYHLTADTDIQRTLFERVQDFWVNHVQAQVPPDVVAQDNPSIVRLFPTHAGPMLDGTLDDLTSLKHIAAAKAQVKEIEKEIAEREAKLKLRIGTAEGLLFPDGSKVTWKSNKDSEIVDHKGIVQKLNPPAELLAAFTTTKPGARVLRITVKEG